MKKRIMGIILVSALGLSLCACGSSGSDNSESESQTSGDAVSTSESEGTTEIADDAYVLRLGAATAGTHPHNVWMEAFEEELEAATDGQIDVQLYPSGQLGTMQELIQGLRDGTVDSAIIPTTYFGTTYMGATVIDLPYLFEDSEQLYRILSENDTLYTQGYEDNGIIPVSYLRLFDRQVLSDTKVESMEDFSSLKLWSLPSAVIQKEVEVMGATISNLDMGELSTSLQNGTVDGALTDISLFLSQSLYTSAKYLLDAPNDAMVSIYAISPEWWDDLPEDLQEIVIETARSVAEETGYPYIDTMAESAIETMEAEGLEVVEPSEEFAAELEEQLSTVTDWYLETYPEYQDIYDELVELIEADEQ